MVVAPHSQSQNQIKIDRNEVTVANNDKMAIDRASCVKQNIVVEDDQNKIKHGLMFSWSVAVPELGVFHVLLAIRHFLSIDISNFVFKYKIQIKHTAQLQSRPCSI